MQHISSTRNHSTWFKARPKENSSKCLKNTLKIHLISQSNYYKCFPQCNQQHHIVFISVNLLLWHKLTKMLASPYSKPFTSAILDFVMIHLHGNQDGRPASGVSGNDRGRPEMAGNRTEMAGNGRR